MKITIEKKEEAQEIEFPCLMKHIKCNTIIFALSYNGPEAFRGYTLKSDYSEIGTPHHCIPLKEYKKFEGKITLEND